MFHSQSQPHPELAIFYARTDVIKTHFFFPFEFMYNMMNFKIKILIYEQWSGRHYKKHRKKIKAKRSEEKVELLLL